VVETASAEGLRLIGHHDLGGHGDGMQVLRDGDALFVGHFGTSGMGTSILDVTDRTAPKLMRQWPAPPNTHTHKVQVADGLLLVNHEVFPYGSDPPPGDRSAGLAVYRLDDPFAPALAGFWESTGRGVHRIVWTGGRHANLSATPEGFDDRIWVIVDLHDPARPVEAGRWWWTCLPLPGRRLVVATDEQLHAGPDAPERRIRVVDVADPARPQVLARCPAPDRAYRQAGLRFGPHNLHENRPGTYTSERLVFATYFNAGLRVYDLEDPARPRELAYWVPRPAPGQVAAQSNDLLVDGDGLVYVTDRVGGGLAILEPEPWLAALMDRSRTNP
jgi:hypothetical protein